jgi:allantoicase
MNNFSEFVNLASERLGARVLEANDEFFAPKSNLLKAAAPVFVEGKFTTRGKWMDGWETRRRRTPGQDWCIIRLGLPGLIHGVVVDTSFFKGNYPERFSLEGCELQGPRPYRNELKRLHGTDAEWVELLPETALAGDTQNSVSVTHEKRFTHLRLRIYPDGGVARFRVYGEVLADQALVTQPEVDLAAIENGGRIVGSSDRFFGEPLNMLQPGQSKNMGDGWETRRRRGPGHDWAIVQLGLPGKVQRVEVDTSHFKGNFPESCSIEACYANGKSENFENVGDWKELLPRTKLNANHHHLFEAELNAVGAATHVRLNIYPDGGVARLRLFGRPERPLDRLTGVERLNQVPNAEAHQSLLDCCGAREWVARMLAHRPFQSIDHLLETADHIWWELDSHAWLEAFRHHPPIGGKKAREKQSAKARRWSEGEQSLVRKAPARALSVLAEANREYQAKFKHIFLICATGKTSEEILENLRQRLGNDPEAELRISAEEQRKITRLRLQKLFAS